MNSFSRLSNYSDRLSFLNDNLQCEDNSFHRQPKRPRCALHSTEHASSLYAKFFVPSPRKTCFSLKASTYNAVPELSFVVAPVQNSSLFMNIKTSDMNNHNWSSETSPIKGQNSEANEKSQCSSSPPLNSELPPNLEKEMYRCRLEIASRELDRSGYSISVIGCDEVSSVDPDQDNRSSKPGCDRQVVPLSSGHELTLKKMTSPALDWCNAVSTTPYLSPVWLKNLTSPCSEVKLSRAKTKSQLEAEVRFWQAQRETVEREKMEELEQRLACLLTSPPILNDPFLKPQPIPQELPYKRPSKAILPILSAAQVEFLNKQLISSGPDTVLVNNFRLAVTRRELITLMATNWLSDMVINFYMQLLYHRSQTVRKAEGFTLPRIAVMSTFFYAKLVSGTGYNGVRRWTRQISLFDQDLILIPIHDRGMHWCLAAADLRSKELSYFDSMGSGNDRCLDALLDYLDAESQDKLKKPLDALTNWKKINTRSSVPQQENGCDCGVFLCTFAEFLSRGADFTFSQVDMPGIRQRMMYEILTQQLLTTKTKLASS